MQHKRAIIILMVIITLIVIGRNIPEVTLKINLPFNYDKTAKVLPIFLRAISIGEIEYFDEHCLIYGGVNPLLKHKRNEINIQAALRQTTDGCLLQLSYPMLKLESY